MMPSISPITRIHSGPAEKAMFGPPKKVKADSSVANVVNRRTTVPNVRLAR